MSTTIVAVNYADWIHFETTTQNLFLQITDAKFFVIGTDVTGKASFLKIDVSDMTTPTSDWHKLMDCPDTGSCTIEGSAAVHESSNIYIILPFGNANPKLVFLTLQASTGNLVNDAFASSDTDWTDGFHLRKNGNLLYILGKWANFKFMIYDSSSNTFTKYYESSISTYSRFVMYNNAEQ